MLRIFFTKTGEAAYISHLDLQRVMARALRRSGLPVWYSQGFNPHIYMSFALPLPLGQESLAETVDIKTESEKEDFSEFLQPLNRALPKGIEATRIALPQHKPVEIKSAEYRIEYEEPRQALEIILDKFQKMPEAAILQKRKKTQEMVDLKQSVQGLCLTLDGAVEARLPAGGDSNVNPLLFTRFLEEQFGLSQNGVKIMRKEVFIQQGQKFC